MVYVRINKDEAKRIAELLAETNTILWNAACQVEALVKDEGVSKLISNVDENRGAYKKIVAIYAQLDKTMRNLFEWGSEEGISMILMNLRVI